MTNAVVSKHLKEAIPCAKHNRFSASRQCWILGGKKKTWTGGM
jgi:hypothetical protein